MKKRQQRKASPTLGEQLWASVEGPGAVDERERLRQINRTLTEQNASLVKELNDRTNVKVYLDRMEKAVTVLRETILAVLQTDADLRKRFAKLPKEKRR